jgi:RNA polymerase sigma-70 factor, ECF subfamily
VLHVSISLSEAGVADAVPDDAVGFAAWVGPHLAVMTACAAQQVGRSDADDVVQEALVRAWRRRSTFDSAKGSVRAWLLAVLYDQSRRHRVRGRRRSDDIERPLPVEQSVERVDIDRAVARLPRRQREVIVLYYLADLAVHEVATVLGISPGTVKSELSDARDRLRAELEES